jgi:oxygen-independent coproporphyrinogen-3 oxidase
LADIPITPITAVAGDESDTAPIDLQQLLSRYLRPGTLSLAAMPPLSLYVHLPWCLKKCPY